MKPSIRERFFLVMLNCNTDNMNTFLINYLSKNYSEDILILVCDGEQKGKGLKKNQKTS